MEMNDQKKLECQNSFYYCVLHFKFISGMFLGDSFLSRVNKEKKIRLTNLKLANKYQVTFDNHLKDSVKNSLNKGI